MQTMTTLAPLRQMVMKVTLLSIRLKAWNQRNKVAIKEGKLQTLRIYHASRLDQKRKE